MIEILSSGATNTVQDQGRPGQLKIGVSAAGAMDGRALFAANTMVGNPADAAVIEISMFPCRIRFHQDLVFSVAGADCALSLGDRHYPSNWAATARKDETLVISSPAKGARVYLALAGGIKVPVVLGSRSTDLKSGFGGHEGRGLIRGDRLEPLSPSSVTLPTGGIGLRTYGEQALPSLDAPVDIKVVPAAEFEVYAGQARSSFFEAEWKVTAEANRMGYRLEGPVLNAGTPQSLFSHGIVPGTVQIPPAGQPIIQLAEANTCGGYPKIATVIQSDLWKLAQAPVGSRLRFVICSLEDAVSEIRKNAALRAHMESNLARLRLN